MKRSECNSDPKRAKERAVSDMRYAVKKLGLPKAIEVIESIVKESLSWNSHDNAVIKAAATAAIKRIVASHKGLLDGRITGKVVLEVL